MSTNAITNLRDGWRMARVGDILKVRNGYAFKSTDYKTEGVPLIRQSNLGDDIVDIADAKRVEPRFLSELQGFVVRDGDLLIGMSGSLGKIARYQHSESALQNQRTGLLQVKPGYEPKFAKLVLKFVEPQILAEGKGIAVQNVSASEIEDCTFPLPSPDEQRRIVAEIEKQFTRLEAGVAALRRVQANLKRYRAAVLKAACEGKLVPTEAELSRVGRVPSRGVRAKTKNAVSGDTAYNDAPFEFGEQLLKRILAEHRRNWTGRGKYKEPAAPDTTNLPPLPEGWTWASVAQLGEATTGFTPPKGNADLFGGDIPFFKPTDLDAGYYVREFRDSLTEAGAEHGRLLPERSVLVTCIGATIGKTGFARVRCATNQQINALTVPPDLISPEFVFWFFNSPLGQEQIKENASATTLPILNKSKFEALAIALPPLAEQTRIVAEVERRLSVVEELESVVSANLQRATRLRQSILQKAFSGELATGTVSD